MLNQSCQSRIRRFFGVLFLISLTVCLWLGNLPLKSWQLELGQVATAQSPNAMQLVQQGIKLYQRGNFRGAIESWQTALNLYQKTNNRPKAAIVQENLARAYDQIGQIATAINYWEGAIAYYRQIGDRLVGRMLAEQAQSYNNLGQPRKAIALLCGADGKQCVPDSAWQIAQTQKDYSTGAAALGSLGNAYRQIGEYEQAIAYLQSSLKVANALDNQVYRASSLNSLGNTYVNLADVNYRRANSAEQRGDALEAKKFQATAFKYDSQAVRYFQDSLKLARTQKDSLAQLQVLLNSILPLRRTKNVALADKNIQQALVLLDVIPRSRHKISAAINLANLVRFHTGKITGFEVRCGLPQQDYQAQKLIQKAISIAQQLQDRRSESFALGQLGHIYECRQDYQQALNFTRQAQAAAKSDLSDRDILYLWEWQAGRIFKAQGKNSQAIQEYSQAVATLESITSDILTADRDLQLDRDIAPIYRELTALRLEQASLPSIEPKQRSGELLSVLDTIDSLKLAELENYFGNDYVLSMPSGASRIDLAQLDKATAIFSSIILENRTAIIVSLPNGEKRLAWIYADSRSLRQVINEFRRGLERYREFTYDPKQAQPLYNWIIRPFAADLDALQIKTLVFIQDGILRSVPMAALHDGEKFLVQKYAIATTPSLTITDPKPLNRKQLQVLALGLTKKATVNGQEFPALTHVEAEINQVKALSPGSKQLLDDDFTSDRLQQELSKTVYPIIHIATHGEFGTDPEQTFLVTGNNDKLTIADLDAAIRSISSKSDVVELLALTACQTAVGDDRAALGLAGVAVSAGVRSVLATLWFIQDAPTVTLVTKFYDRLLNSKVSKAEALQAAQQALIAMEGQYAHPAYWAPFILIGNWL